jgi:hypothetical protein
MGLPYDAERVHDLRNMLGEARQQKLSGWRSGKEDTTGAR